MESNFEWITANGDIGIRFFHSIDDGGYSNPPHWHNDLEIIYLLEGRLKVRFGDGGERQTDFIFSVCGEELGFLGCALIIVLLLAIVVRCLLVARDAATPMESYVCVGMAGMLIFQTIANIGMCLFITSGISGTPLKDIIREIWWPIIVMLIVLAVITYIPDVVLFLPKLTGMMA